MARKEKLSSCCIFHEFSKSATQNPNKIAVIHACSGAKITRQFRAGGDTDDYDGFYGAVAPSTHPPVFNGDICFTFGEIMSAVDQVSAMIRCVLDGGDGPHLKSANTGSEQYPKIIGIYIVPSVEYIIAVLSVLRCGEAFMPINPTWPKERISSILSLSNASLIIRSQYNFDGSHSYEPDKLQRYEDNVHCPELFISIKECIEQERGLLSLPWPCEIENSRFCYLMYTSGSTGKPKGVCGTEIGLLNRFLWMKESYSYLDDEVLLFKTPISFIDHLQEVLGALLTASTLIIPPFNEIEENSFVVYDFLQAYSINRLITVPSLIRVVLPALQSPYSTRVQNSLRLLVLSGEVFPLSLWETLHEFLPETTILNLYGSTEVSGDCTYFDCNKLPSILESEALTSVPIGMPISNCDIVLAGKDSPVQGEIYIGGLGISIGYYDDLSINSSDFVKSPHGSYDCSVSMLESQYHFKSGDLARQLKSGDLLFLGRKDRTVKVNGHRIALEEIEGTLRGYQGVADAVVISRSHQDAVLLEAYIIMRPEVVNNKKLKYSLRSWMLGKLPLAMIPNRFFFIKSFPLSSTGKVDYDMFASLKFSTKYEQSGSDNIQSTEYLQVIKKVFSGALKVEMVSDDDDFFEMGGNSISAAHASHNLGIDMRLLYMFSSPTSLHMVLLEKEGTSSIGVGTYASRDSLLLSFDAKAASDHASKSNKSSRALYSQSDDYPTKCRKMNPCFYDKSKALNFGDDYPWKSTSINGACSISHCNKVFFVGVNEGYKLHQPTLSLHFPRDSRGVMQQPWKIYMESCVDASPLVVLKDDDMFLFIGSHSYRFFCIDVKSCCTRWEIKLEGRIECSAAILDNLSQVVVGCYQGNIYFLDFSNGNIYWSFRTAGEHLETVIKARIPSITSMINKNIDELESEMDHLGRPIGADAGAHLYTILELCRAFDKIFKEHLDGGRPGGDRIYGVFDNQLPAALRKLPFDRHLSLQNVKKVISESDGYQPHLIAPEQGYRRLIDGALNYFRGPAEASVDAVHFVLKELVRKSIGETEELRRFPTLQAEIAAAAGHSLEKFRDESKKTVVRLVDMESSYLTVDFFRKLPQEVEKVGPPPAGASPVDRLAEGHFRRIASNVSSYIGMICETLKITIPKAVVYCQVREAKRNLLNFFYTQVGRKEAKQLAQLLDEDPALMDRRQQCAKRLELYKAARDEIDSVSWAR